MVKTKLFLLLITAGLLYNCPVQAQQVNTVKRSNNKVELNNKPYYIHIVRKGETLYAISKAYQVDADTIKKDNLHISNDIKINQYLKIRIHDEEKKQQKFVFYEVKKGDTPYNISVRYHIKLNDLYQYNPSARLGIGINEVLKIPVILKKPKIETKDTITESDFENEAFVIHKVKSKETLYGIAAKYMSTHDEIIKLNPQLKEKSLQVDDELKIPISEKVRNNENNDFYYHEVKKQETIYSLIKLYDIKERIFLKYNPEFKDRVMRIGELVKVPKNAISDTIFNTIVEKDSVIAQPEPDQFVFWTDSLILPPCPDVFIDSVNKYKIAFFLPFYLNHNDTLGKYVNVVVRDENGVETIETEIKPGHIEDKIYPRSKLFIDFYQGALLALEDLKKQGISFDIHVFDTQNDSLFAKQQLKQNNLADFDLFIGPVYDDVLNIVSSYAREHQINIVSPLASNNGFIEHNSYAFQVSPPLEVQMHHASDFLHGFDTKNYIVIHDGKNLDQEYISQFKTELFAQMNDSNFDQVKYNEILYYDAQDSVLKEVFSKGINNIVIVPSSNRAFVTDVLGKLNGYSYEYSLTVFGQPYWSKFTNISLENFHNTNTHLFSNSFIDYKKDDVIKFVNDFRKNFNDEPDKYAFSGYDITNYFCSALNKYGPDFRKCIHTHHPNLLQTNFSFVPYSDQGGYQNTAIYLIEYSSDNKIKMVGQFPKYLDDLP